MTKKNKYKIFSTWKQYENQVFEKFKAKYQDQEILFDQKIKCRYSRALRQVDVLIRVSMADSDQYGIFDCKKFNKKIDVRIVDTMVGFMDDLNANYGGIVTCIGFSKAAEYRAQAANIKLEIIKFDSPEQIIDRFVPSFDFSDPRNSMYLPLI